jgi:hypothetical protein
MFVAEEVVASLIVLLSAGAVETVGWEDTTLGCPLSPGEKEVWSEVSGEWLDRELTSAVPDGEVCFAVAGELKLGGHAVGEAVRKTDFVPKGF